MFYQQSVISDGETCCAAGTPRLAKLDSPPGITEAKMSPACSAFRGLHSCECELFQMPTFICWKKKEAK